VVFAVLSAVSASAFPEPARAQSDDDITGYYWGKSATVWATSEASRSRMKYRLRCTTVRTGMSRTGKFEGADTLVADYYFTGTGLDSVKTVDGSIKNWELVELWPPDVYSLDYSTSAFPNDDGRGGLAVGLDTDSTMATEPTGLAVLDRFSYRIHRLYLYYPPFGDYIRLSRSFQFQEQDGIVYPDSIWTIAARRGLFYPDRFRLDSDIEEVEVYME
jgi:hypothetical protein